MYKLKSWKVFINIVFILFTSILGPSPNYYVLPTTVGYRKHDCTKRKNPAYTVGQKLPDESAKLGPGLYNLFTKTRFGLSHAPRYTLAPRLNDTCNFLFLLN